MPKAEEPTEELLTALALSNVPGVEVREPKSIVPTGGPLAQLRARHHHLARLVAEGKKLIEAAYITGYAPTTVHNLQQDPAFKELVEYYKVQVVEQYLDYHQKAGVLAATAAEVLLDRLEENPGKFTNDDLRKIIDTGAQVAQPGPKNLPSGPGVSISVNFVAPQQEPKTIDLKSEEQAA